MKKNNLLNLAALIALGAGGWYLYRRSKGLPFFPVTVTATTTTGATAATGSGTSVGSTIATVQSGISAAESLLGALTSGASPAASSLGISGGGSSNTDNAGVDDDDEDYDY